VKKNAKKEIAIHAPISIHQNEQRCIEKNKKENMYFFL